MNIDKSIFQSSNQPLKCILTNNRSSIQLLSKTGNLIIYEPAGQPDDPDNEKTRYYKYREIWLANQFIAGGWGVRSKDIADILNNQIDYDTLLNIIKVYNDTINGLNDKDAQLESDLDKKLDREGRGANASKTYIKYNNGVETFNIPLDQLIYLQSNLPTYIDAEITSIDYEIKTYDREETYKNKDRITIGSKVQYIKIHVKGKLNDSDGIEKCTILLHDDNGTVYEYNPIVYENLSDEFEIIFRKQYDASFPYTIEDGINNFIDKFELLVKGTAYNKYRTISVDVVEFDINDNATYINKPIKVDFGKIQEHTLDVEPPIVYGVYPIFYKIFGKDEAENLTTNINKYNEYESKPMTYHSYIESPNYTFIEIGENQYIVSLLIPNNFCILNAYFIDTITMNEYDIKDMCNFNENVDDDINIYDEYDQDKIIYGQLNKYVWRTTPNDVQTACPEFIINDLDETYNGAFNKGYIKLEILETTNIIDKYDMNNESSLRYWRSIDKTDETNQLILNTHTNTNNV